MMLVLPGEPLTTCLAGGEPVWPAVAGWLSTFTTVGVGVDAGGQGTWKADELVGCASVVVGL